MSRRLMAATVALAGLLLLPLSGGAAPAQKRVALVIGNSAYQNVAKLSNPMKDATAVAEMFKKAGFEWVKVRQDVGNLEFKRALREFNDAAQDADVAVVYYAGHGIQVKDMNYMIPVDARLATEFDAEDEAVSLDRIVLAIEPAKRLRLVILDACRDNPFARTMKRRVAMRAVTSGLAKMEPMLGDTLIAYAAKAGSSAEDGDGVNSPFAAALVKHLAVPGLDIRLAFGRVRDDVLKSTGNKQEPFVYGSLGGESISLVPAPAQPKAAPLADVKADYELVERFGTRKAWEAFLGTHKEGLYADLARAQLARILEQEKRNAPAPAAPADASSAPRMTLAAIEPAAPPKPSGPSTEERRAWDRIRDSGDRGKLRDFIAKYPASPLADTAKNRLDSLERAAQEREEKARAEREAAQRRDEEAKRLKAEEAERKNAEREAAQRREEEAKRLKAEEAERKNAEREAAQRRDEEAKRLKAEEAERKNAEREAAKQREEEARLAKSAEKDRQAKDEACARDEDRLARLRASVSQGWAREDLKRLERATPCDRVRSAVAALLAQPAAEATKPPAAPQPPVNTPELVIAAQSELRRLGCFAGQEDGNLGGATKEAVQRYLSQKGRPTNDVKITDSFVANLKDESSRVCPLTCARGEHPEGDRCVADAKPEKPEKTKATARERDDEDKAAARAKAKREEARREREQARREEARREREQARREERRREARPKPERAKPERAASRPAPQPVVRTQAAAPRHSGGSIVGVGF